MNQTSEPRSSLEDRPSATSYPAGVPATAVRETVLNPEGRSASTEGSTSSTLSAPQFPGPVDPGDASLWRRLFPSDIDPSGSDDVEAAAGCDLGHFSIEERIGSGGMGAVFRALDTRLQRVVALKVLSPVQSRDRAAVMRFQNEARAAARLDHENIARVFYIGEDRGLHFIAFEYITGQNVRDIITRSGRLRVAEAVNNILQIAAALRHTAAAGVVHRDVKPSNIIIAPNGRAKLVDLGLARKLTSDSMGDLTIAGTTLGTFDYISPEQARDPRNVDIRSDIYSLGCTLYHMLTGGPPYSSGTVLQKLLDHQQGHAPDPRAVNPTVPPALSAICRKMMAGDPKNRYATPDELIRDLAVVATGMGLRPTMTDAYIWTRPPARTSRIRPGFIWAGSAAVVLVLAALADVWPTNRGYVDVPDRPAPVANAAGTAPQSVIQQANATEETGMAAPADPVTNSTPDSEAYVPPPEISVVPPASTGIEIAKNAAPRAVSPEDGTPTPVEAESMTPPEIPSPSDPPLNAAPAGEQALNDLFQGTNSLAGAFLSVYNAVASPSRVDTDQSAEQVIDGDPVLHSEVAVTPIRIVPPFTILPTDEMVRPDDVRTAETLAEALNLAENGDVIELRFDGALPDGPITTPIHLDDREVVIKAGSDASGRPYRPVLEFASDPSGMIPARMIVLEGDSAGLTVEDIQVRMTVNDVSLSDPAALFVLAGAGRVSLDDVAITIDSPRRSCSVFDVISASDPAAQQMSLMGMGSDRETFEISVAESFFRGSADLVTIGHTEPGEIDIRNSGIALRQSLLSVTGGITFSSDAVVDVALTHVTAVLGNPLLRVDLSSTSRYFAPLHIVASNNVIATRENGQLVFMNAAAEGTDFSDALVWTGERNTFDGFSEFWSVKQSAGGTSMEFPGTFLEWRQYWERYRERNDLQDDLEPEQSVAAAGEAVPFWDNPDAKSLEPIEFNPAHLRLDPKFSSASQIEIQSTDSGGLIGADPEALPTLTVSTDGSVAHGSESTAR